MLLRFRMIRAWTSSSIFFAFQSYLVYEFAVISCPFFSFAWHLLLIGPSVFFSLVRMGGCLLLSLSDPCSAVTALCSFWHKKRSKCARLMFIRILIYEAEVQLWPLLAVYNTGVSNPGGVMPIQQQQLGSQEAFGNMQPNAQNLQSSMAVTVYFSWQNIL